jgi:preprotein translocase subunit YajC
MSSVGGFLVLVVLLAVVWLVFLLPARRRRETRERSHLDMQDSLEIGDEIITAGGLHAVIRGLGENQLEIEIAPGVVATLDRRAVAAVAREIEVEVEPVSAPEPRDEPR